MCPIIKVQPVDLYRRKMTNFICEDRKLARTAAAVPCKFGLAQPI